MTTTSRIPGPRITPEVWDLADTSAYPVARVPAVEPVPRPGPAGPIAAAIGLVAVGAAVVPGLPVGARWVGVLVLGGIALAVGIAALRRRQILLTALLAIGGAAAPVVGAVLILVLPQVAPPIENTVLPAGAPPAPSTTVTTTSALDARVPAERVTASDTAASLALHLRAMHGVSGPFPAALDSATGTLVERGGLIGDVQVGIVPQGMHVRYSVAPDQRYFQIRVELDEDRAAAATADSTIDPVDAG